MPFNYFFLITFAGFFLALTAVFVAGFLFAATLTAGAGAAFLPKRPVFLGSFSAISAKALHSS
jgi:hypothetical protein